MSTALVRAVELAFPDPTIKNVFSAYLKEAGFDAFRLPFGDGKASSKDKAVTETTTEVTETAHDAREKGFEGSWQSDAVAAFERAMDKHPNDDKEITGVRGYATQASLWLTFSSSDHPPATRQVLGGEAEGRVCALQGVLVLWTATSRP